MGNSMYLFQDSTASEIFSDSDTHLYLQQRHLILKIIVPFQFF